MKRIVSLALVCAMLLLSCFLTACKAPALKREENGGFRNPQTDICYYPAPLNYYAKPYGEDAYAKIKLDNGAEDVLLYQIEGADPERYLVSNGYTIYCAEGAELPELLNLPCVRVGIYDTQVSSNDGNITNADEILALKELHKNGAHTSLVPYALLEGKDTVKSCMDDPVMSTHLKKCVFDEIIPTLDLPKAELEAYANDVLTRFSNPYIKHYLSSIALNSVSKFKVRVLPSILEYIKRFNKMPETLIFSFAKLIDFYRTDMVNDSKEVEEFMKTATVKEILEKEEYWGQNLGFLLPEVEKYVNK